MKVFIVVLLIVVSFGAYLTVFRVHTGEYGLLLNDATGEVEQVFPEGYNFVPGNISFWKHSVVFGKMKSSAVFDVRVPLPGLAEIESRHYAVDIKIQAKYELDLENAHDDMLASRELLVKMLKSICRDSFESEMLPYLYPVYDSAKLELKSGEVAEKGFELVRKRCKAAGVNVYEIALIGPLRVPSPDIYREGLALAADLRKIENDSRKEQMLLENKLKKDAIEQKKYLENLREIAKVVKNNPDLLKYLYITGFSKNVSTIIAPDRSGLPFGLDFSEKGSAPKAKGDVDNLR
jgi:hypothetical protein